MQDLPKIVKARLREQRPAMAVTHPDADVLTAFIEQALTDRERLSVRQHIADCAECRDVVALALPGAEDMLRAPQRGRRMSWLALPVLRWSAAAAVLVIISAGVFEFKWHHEQTVLTALNVPAAAPVVGQQYAPAGSSESKTSAAQAEVSNKQVTQAQEAREATADSSRAQPKAALLPSPLPAMTVNKKSPAPQTGASSLSSAGTNDSNASQMEIVDKAKAAPPEALSSGLVLRPDLRADPSLMKGHSLVRWVISESGTLQRSVDGGSSWQDVNVFSEKGAELRPAKNTTTVEVSAASQTTSGVAVNSEAARVAAKPISQAATSPAPQPIVFRAVSVSSDANEVWAGGSGAILFHTVDAGNSWVRVLPSDGGAVLTGDVIRVQFPDTQSGTVSTSNRETWITFDDGKTWHKQP